MKRKRQFDAAELEAFPAEWKRPEFDIDRPGRDFDAGGFYLTVSCNAAIRSNNA